METLDVDGEGATLRHRPGPTVAPQTARGGPTLGALALALVVRAGRAECFAQYLAQPWASVMGSTFWAPRSTPNSWAICCQAAFTRNTWAGVSSSGQ